MGVLIIRFIAFIITPITFFYSKVQVEALFSYIMYTETYNIFCKIKVRIVPFKPETGRINKANYMSIIISVLTKDTFT